MHKYTFTSRRRSAGLTLVEILVALLVISVGLLGVAGLHAMSLRNNYDALMRTHASALAADIVDRMRANRAAALEDDSEYAIALDDEDVDVSGNPTVAALDLYAWRQSLKAQLPRGNGSVAIDEDTHIVTVVIEWGERESDEDNDDLISFTTRTEI